MGAPMLQDTNTPFDTLVVSHVGEISGRELSRRTGVVWETFADIRKGARVPRLHVIERIADGLGLDREAVREAVLATVTRGRAKRSAKP